MLVQRSTGSQRAGMPVALPLPAGGEPPGRARGAPPPPPRRPPGRLGGGGGCSRRAVRAPGALQPPGRPGREEVMNIQRGRRLSARCGSLKPQPPDARRRQREPPVPRKLRSGRRARGVGAASSAPRSSCAPRDASPPRQSRQAPPCGRRCHVPGEARGGRSGD